MEGISLKKQMKKLAFNEIDLFSEDHIAQQS